MNLFLTYEKWCLPDELQGLTGGHQSNICHRQNVHLWSAGGHFSGGASRSPYRRKEQLSLAELLTKYGSDSLDSSPAITDQNAYI